MNIQNKGDSRLCRLLPLHTVAITASDNKCAITIFNYVQLPRLVAHETANIPPLSVTAQQGGGPFSEQIFFQINMFTHFSFTDW